MAREFSIRTPYRTFHVRTGTEGPRFDPYSFTEYTIVRPGKATIVYHNGLAEWIKVGKRLLNNSPTARQEFERYSGGFTPEQIELFHERISSRCECGSRQTRSERGYPGETLNVCVKCGNVVSGEFNKSAVI